ncbi:HAD-IA family hydrolase [Streptomyces gobiensis]|uniref:HAD-IA family hydrolase n=1 Tax=Streptomyces gobiensis TaxID=2875706 RepID=UPI001E467404|nr:HAD-IA family hydrolase [Streptomyces gobiensis]UGY94912.1 HAD-IA family hydrolase [Streptomyces gobiensis]
MAHTTSPLPSRPRERGQDIDAVLFDIGGTIYDDERYVQALYRAVCELAGDVDEVEFWTLYDVNREGAEMSLRTAFARRFVPGGDAALLHKHIVKHWEYPAEALYPDVKPSLQVLARQYRLGIVSSSPPQVREALRRDGLDGLFDTILLGGVDTVEKPDPRAFRTALERMGVPAARAVYVGNRLDADIRGSARAGLRTVWMLRGEAPPAPTLSQLGEADAVITSLTGLPMALARLTNRAAPAPTRVRGVSTAALDITEQYRTRQRLAIVNAASVRIGTTLDIARTAQELADVATERFADFVSVDLLDFVFQGTSSHLSPATGPVVFCRAAHQSVLHGCPESVVEPGQPDPYPEDSPMARALASGRPSRHWIDDTDIQRWLAHDSARARAVREHGIHSLIVLPLLARGSTLGLVQFLRHRTPDTFDADDLLLAEEITARAALSIDNARRYTRERETALALQRSLLPQRTPRQAAVDVASRYRPASSKAGVGGDWYDVIPLSGARVALVVGDVVGHGLQASATMGRLRTAVRTLADVDMPPDELLTHLDDLVLRLDREEGPLSGEAPRDTGEIGATCLYGVYDPVTRRCTLARAGHPAPAVVRPDGAVDFPDLPAGPPLGLGSLPFESAELELPEGSLIALYTDGLIVSADHDVDVALQRLRHALTSDASSLEETCDNVLQALPLPGRAADGADAADDMALLLARTHALDTSQVATWELPSDPAVVSRARQMTVDQLAAWGLDEAAFITELVVSELVTNAIRYARPPIQLRLIHETSLICEVSDASSTSPHLRRARVFDEGGRGLLLVAQLTERWGTRYTPTGKTIWTEQTLPAGRY